MIFKLGEWFCGTSGLARGEALRRTIGFVVMDAGAIRGTMASSVAIEDNRKRQGEIA